MCRTLPLQLRQSVPLIRFDCRNDSYTQPQKVAIDHPKRVHHRSSPGIFPGLRSSPTQSGSVRSAIALVVWRDGCHTPRDPSPTRRQLLKILNSQTEFFNSSVRLIGERSSGWEFEWLESAGRCQSPNTATHRDRLPNSLTHDRAYAEIDNHLRRSAPIGIRLRRVPITCRHSRLLKEHKKNIT